MLEKQITTVLFDLDGTLLPMKMEDFVGAYFSCLAKEAAPYGYEAKPLVSAVWKGTNAMIENDGSKSNCDRFWDVFASVYGEESRGMQPIFDRFYAENFHKVKAATGENPLAKTAVEALKARGYQVVLATNPVFPAVAVRTRLSWIGLAPEDFSHVTSYENSSFCKPNPMYYREILEALGKRPEECLMVGNDGVEDTAALDAGLSVYLITDCLEHAEGLERRETPRGSFREFLAWAGLEGGSAL